MLLILCGADCLIEKHIPDKLGMALCTFKTHKEHLFAKLKVDTRHKLIVRAEEWGLVECSCQQLRRHLPAE